jgi:cobaltochelatase CobT
MSDLVLRKSLPYLLGIVAAGAGVSIKTDPNAKTAATDGKVVILPPLPYTGGDLAIYALGFIVHEAGHLRSTDFTVLKGKPITGLQKMLLNVLEDIRIERLINGVFPGARHWLNALTKKFVETNKQGVVDPEAPLTTILLRYLQDWLYESVLGYNAVKGIGEQQRILWQSKVSPELAAAVEKVALSAAWATSTYHVLDATNQILNLIEQEAEKAEAEQQAAKPGADEDGDGQGSEGEQPQDAEGAEPNKASDSDPGAQSSDDAGVPDQDDAAGAADDATGQPVDGQSDSAAAEGERASPGTSTERDPLAYAQELNEVLQSEEIAQGADRGESIREEMKDAVGSINNGKESTFSLPTVLPAQGVQSDAEALNRVRGASTALRYRMDEFLQANTMKRYSVSDRGKRLTRDAAKRLSMCDPRIFQKRTPGQKIDTAVHVLIDISGSMSRQNRCQVAIDAALALGLALEDVEGVKYSVSAFPFHNSDVVELVNPGESIRDVAFRFRSMSPNGFTPLDKGLLQAHTTLMTTNATRRVCLVITDGEPDDIDASRLVVNMGESDGIEHMAIGIECPVSHITKNACVVTDLADLPRQVIGMMQGVILLPKAA